MKNSNPKLEFVRNLVHNYVHGIGSDIKIQIIAAAQELGAALDEVDRRYQGAGHADLISRAGMYFIITGEKYPGKTGYSWA